LGGRCICHAYPVPCRWWLCFSPADVPHLSLMRRPKAGANLPECAVLGTACHWPGSSLPKELRYRRGDLAIPVLIRLAKPTGLILRAEFPSGFAFPPRPGSGYELTAACHHLPQPCLRDLS
jgi:hypothetical protein